MAIDALYPNQLADHSWLPKDRERTTFTLFHHAGDHNRGAAEIVAIERELGTNPSAEFDTVSDRLDSFNSRITALEDEGEGNFVNKAGDTMTGGLTLPELIMGNISGNLEGIKFNDKGYITPLDNFINDAFRIKDINGNDLFVVPFNGGAVTTKNGATVLTSANHIHRNDVENDARYFLRSDDIGHAITLSGVRDRYQEFTLGADGTTTLTLNTDNYNHFKIRTNGANADVNITGVPTSAFRKGITICLQNIGSSPSLLRVLNSNTWADVDVAPDLTTNPGKDTEIFAYTIGEGDRWLLHRYYINKTVRSLAAVYPTQMTHFWKFFGRGNITPLTIADEKTSTVMNFANNVQFTLEGAQMAAATSRYMYSDKVPGLTLQSNLAIISVIKNIGPVEEFAALASIASSVRTTNYLRADKLSGQRLRAKIASQTGSYTNATNDTPAAIVNSGTSPWTMVAIVKDAQGYGVYNINLLAAGASEAEYLARREFSATQTFDAATDMRVGVGIVPMSNYTTTPTGLGTFLCAGTMVLEGTFNNVELMQTYRAVRQEMLGLGLTSLPAPAI